MPRIGFLLLCFLSSLCSLCLCGEKCFAHPVPSENHDRFLVVRLTAEKVVVDYRLELDETRAARDLPVEELRKIQDPNQFFRAFTDFFGPVLANNLVATLDGVNGKPLEFQCVRRGYQVLDHLRCDFRFEARWSPAPGQAHVFRLREGNYEDDDFSRLRLTLTADPSLTLRTALVPDETLMDRPAAERRPGDGERLRKAEVTFDVVPVEQQGKYRPTLPPDVDLPREGPSSTDGTAAVLKGRPGPEAALAKPDERAPGLAPGFSKSPRGVLEPAEGAESSREEDPESFSSRPGSVAVLLHTGKGMWLVLGIVALWGAAHALQPGHGKTLVAAYLVGERGTIWHALLLGLVTTLTHTGAVLILAGLLPLFFPREVSDSAQKALGLACGLAVAGVGCWVLLRRLAGQADHFHFGHSHSHSHDHGHGHGHGHSHSHGHSHGHFHEMPRGVSWFSLVILGMAGGILPCPEAMFILGESIREGNVWMGLPLLLAFSAGLATVLIAIGMGVVCVRGFADARWGESRRLRSVFAALPLVSALLVTALGIWMCYDSVHS
jgi:ABC-type nickel/cobalt efflux system permease component RcnA